MKRNSPELAPNSEVHVGAPPAKSQRRAKESPGPTQRKAVAAASMQKPREDASVESSPLLAAAAVLEVAGDEAWQGAAELGVGLKWWWGVEEEKLFGWFPFADKDFLCFEDAGSGRTEYVGGLGLLWEEDHDIWQLQQIHEIPSRANQQ